MAQLKDPYMKVDQIAEFFQVTPYTVREWLKDPDNGLVGTKFGNAWRIRQSVVIAFANEKYGEKS